MNESNTRTIHQRGRKAGLFLALALVALGGAGCPDRAPMPGGLEMLGDAGVVSCERGDEADPLACADGCDNDGDGFVDCEDVDCGGSSVCTPGEEPAVIAPPEQPGSDPGSEPDAGTDAGTDEGCIGGGCVPEGLCSTGPESSPGACEDGCDNDSDGRTDCADSECAGIGGCPGPTPATPTAPPECSPGQTGCAGDTAVQCTGDGHWTAVESCSRGCYEGACIGPRTITIVNDLTDVVAGPNDWGRYNTVISVRFGPTESAVVTTTTGERLVRAPTDFIAPGGGTRTFDTDSQGTDYWLFVQNGWWEYFCPSGCSWTKHHTVVVGCDCATEVYKYRPLHVTGHVGGDLVVHLSDFLPPGNYCSSAFCS